MTTIAEPCECTCRELASKHGSSRGCNALPADHECMCRISNFHCRKESPEHECPCMCYDPVNRTRCRARRHMCLCSIVTDPKMGYSGFGTYECPAPRNEHECVCYKGKSCYSHEHECICEEEPNAQCRANEHMLHIITKGSGFRSTSYKTITQDEYLDMIRSKRITMNTKCVCRRGKKCWSEEHKCACKKGGPCLSRVHECDCIKDDGACLAEIHECMCIYHKHCIADRHKCSCGKIEESLQNCKHIGDKHSRYVNNYTIRYATHEEHLASLQ